MATKVYRSRKEIKEEFERCWDIIWYNRNLMRLKQMDNGKDIFISPDDASICLEAMRNKEEQYGIEVLLVSPLALADLEGRMATLNWLNGIDWNEGCYDT